jgi:hypothetical protein
MKRRDEPSVAFRLLFLMSVAATNVVSDLAALLVKEVSEEEEDQKADSCAYYDERQLSVRREGGSVPVNNTETVRENVEQLQY